MDMMCFGKTKDFLSASRLNKIVHTFPQIDIVFNSLEESFVFPRLPRGKTAQNQFAVTP